MTHDRTDDDAPVTLDREDAASPVIDRDLDARDEGLGGVPPEEITPLEPNDEGVGNIRFEEIAPPDPGDEGVGSVRPEETAPADPDDEGLGSLGTNG